MRQINIVIFLFFVTASITCGQNGIKLANQSAFSSILNKQIVVNSIPLKIGDEVPDLSFSNILNYKHQQAKLSDFKGKLVILDFWNVHCAACINEFPKLEYLQSKFGEKIFILPIGIQQDKFSHSDIIKFLKRREENNMKINLPTTVEKIMELEDSDLYRLFPFQDMPYEVWINEDGKLIGLTDHRTVTEKNILSVLSGELPILPTKKTLKHIDPCIDSFLLGQVTHQETEKCTVHSYIDTLSYSPQLLDNINSNCNLFNWHLISVNQTIFNIYKQAYQELLPELRFDHYNKRLIFESKEKEGTYKDWFVSEFMDNWQFQTFAKRNLFNFEIVLPKSRYRKPEILSVVRSKLDSFFNLTSRVELRDRNYWEVSLESFASKDLSKQDFDVRPVFKIVNDSIEVSNYPLSDFVHDLNALIKDKLIMPSKAQDSIAITFKTHKVGFNKTLLSDWVICLANIGINLIQKQDKLETLILTESSID